VSSLKSHTKSSWIVNIFGHFDSIYENTMAVGALGVQIPKVALMSRRVVVLIFFLVLKEISVYK
jgi:hypothetical protein